MAQARFLRCYCIVICVVVFVANEMWCPESGFSGEQLEHFRRLEASPGPQDPWRAREDRAATKSLSLSAKAREAVGVDPEVASL